MGFWSHPHFTLEMAQAAFKWIGAAPHPKPPDEIVLIEHVASDDYADCYLFAVWWWGITNQQREADAPMAIPAGYTQFRFRSYEPVDNEYLVLVVGEPKDYETTLPFGTIVTVRC